MSDVHHRAHRSVEHDPSPARCPYCGKHSYRDDRAARRAIARAQHRLVWMGVLSLGGDPAGLAPVRPYRCRDNPAGDWHVTSEPLLQLELPEPRGPRFDVVAAVAKAIQDQPGRVFPDPGTSTERYGLGQREMGLLRAALCELGLVVQEPVVGTLLTRRDLAVSVEHIKERMWSRSAPPPSVPLLPLPPAPAVPDRVPEVLLEAILAHTEGMRLSALPVLARHFTVNTSWMRRVREALAELGFLRVEQVPVEQDHKVYLSARPPQEREPAPEPAAEG